jgi:hypothetical protein
LGDPLISIPSGITGNFLNETATAVKAFQRKYGLLADGVAGQKTITRLDAVLHQRAQDGLQTMGRVLQTLSRHYSADAERARILREMEQTLQSLRQGNQLGLALTVPVIAIIVVLFFLLMWLSLPQTQKTLRELMKRTIEAVNERGEVAQEKLQELKKEVSRFLDQAGEIKTDCMTETLTKDPRKHAECLRKFGLAHTAAFNKLIRTLKGLFSVVYDAFGRGRFRIPPDLRLTTLASDFKDYMNALNDLLNCMGCPEVPFPQFPSDPDFPL